MCDDMARDGERFPWRADPQTTSADSIHSQGKNHKEGNHTMNTDIKTRIEALRPPPTPPGTPATAAATPAPDDPKNLLPMFIDLVAELFVAIKDMQRVAADTESAVKRFQQEVPAACRQVVREEVHFLRAQATEQHRVPQGTPPRSSRQQRTTTIPSGY